MVSGPDPAAHQHCMCNRQGLAAAVLCVIVIINTATML
jgi:hypothetical protein